MAHYIYCIQNKIDLKVYIGQTINLKRRFKEHIKYSRHSKYLLYRAMRKHGVENFSFTEIDKCESLEESNELEIFWISFFNSMSTCFGYNLRPGGNCVGFKTNFKHSEKTKSYLKQIMLGKKASSITLEKLSGQNNCNSKLTNDSCKEMRKIYLSELFSLREIAKLYNMHYTTIKKILKNQAYIDNNFQNTEKILFIMNKKYKHPNKMSFKLVDNFGKTYSSFSKAVKEHSIKIELLKLSIYKNESINNLTFKVK